MLNKNETGNTLTTLTLLFYNMLKRVQVYLNYFHSTGTQQVAQTQLLVGVIGSFEKSRLEQ